MQIPKLSAIRYNKTWVVLGVALGIGVLAALGARNYLANRMAEIDAKARGNLTNVVVAKRDLKAGERISEETVAIRPIPAEYVQSQAIRPEAFERVSGQALAFPLNSGEMLVWSVLEAKKAPTFSKRVALGRRAITVAVDEISSISGLLEPGDLIDLILTVDQRGRKASFVVQENVSVLATGQRAVDDPKSGERRSYSTVTFDTSPDEANIIIRAREAGKLTALLRNPQDSQAVADPEISRRFLKNLAGDASQVPVLYGGKAASFTPEALNLASGPRSGIVPDGVSPSAQRGPMLGGALVPPPAPAEVLNSSHPR